MKFLALLIVFGAQASTPVPLPKQFITALHQVETGGKLGAIKGARGELGPLQITKRYWLDSMVEGKFEMVISLDYATKVVTQYLNRYAQEACIKKDFQTLARIHNGGLTGHKKKVTIKYWKKVQKYL